MTLPDGVPALRYIQGQFAAISQHRITVGIGHADVLPGLDFDLFAGGMFKNTDQFAVTIARSRATGSARDHLAVRPRGAAPTITASINTLDGGALTAQPDRPGPLTQCTPVVARFQRVVETEDVRHTPAAFGAFRAPLRLPYQSPCA